MFQRVSTRATRCRPNYVVSFLSSKLFATILLFPKAAILTFRELSGLTVEATTKQLANRFKMCLELSIAFWFHSSYHSAKF